MTKRKTIRNVLIFEGDSKKANKIKEPLLKEGYSVWVIDNGESALEASLTYHPHVIITNVMLPKVSGWDVIDVLKNTPETQEAPIIVVTGLSRADDKQRAADLGAVEYLVAGEATSKDIKAAVQRHIYDNDQKLSTNSKQQHKAKLKLGLIIGVGAAIVLFAVWYYSVGLGRGPSAYGSGDGSIDVFPQSNSVKNYRLDAQIEVYGQAKDLISNYKQYKIDSADWPDGGTLDFDPACYTTDLQPRSLCKSTDGRSYYIEVVGAPSFDHDSGYDPNN